MAAEGGAPKRLTNDPASDIMPSWSIAEKWIFFTSGRSGTQQLWRISVTGGAATQLTKGGARESWPSPDGQRVYCTRRCPEAEIWTVPASGGVEEPVSELTGFPRISRAWGVIRDGIYFTSREDKPRQMLSVHLNHEVNDFMLIDNFR